MKRDYVKIAEIGTYIGFAFLMASVTAVVFHRNLALEQQSKIVRSKSDAAILIAALNLRKGQSAIIEFMDFECPPCRMSYPKIKAQLSKCPLSVFREVNFPLPMHPFAFGAAVASEIAREGGKHDEVFEYLFSGKVALDEKSMNTYLRSRKLPGNVGAKESADHEKKVKDDIALGKALNINSTPTVMVLSRDGTLTEVRNLDLIPELLN